MKRIALLLAAAGVAALAIVSGVFASSSASLPASKATVAIDSLIDIGAKASDPSTPGTTGWTKVLAAQIKTSSQKDLVFDVALQCGIVTDTTVASKNGSTSTSKARGTIAVRVLVDGRPALPSNSIDATKATAEGVVYCDRIQTLVAKFSGLNCTLDASGAVTCADPETLQLILETLNASAFNFAFPDVGVGIDDIVVEAKADASVNFSDGALAGAEAFLGAGSMTVDEVRYVKGLNPIVDLA